MTTYELTAENEQLISAKAKLKKDGVYTFRGVVYRVKDGYVTHYATGGNVSEHYGRFLVDIGNYVYESEAMKMLKGIL